MLISLRRIAVDKGEARGDMLPCAHVKGCPTDQCQDTHSFMKTIQSALQYAVHLLKATSHSPHLDAQLLLCRVLSVEKSTLIAYPERALTDAQQQAFVALVQRRAQGEPVSYILGSVGFYDLELFVTPAVLIPRPETEHLVEEALRWGQARDGLTIADVGTGSGAIAITCAKHLPQATVHATDRSADALTIARKNAAHCQVRVQFHEGHLAQPLLEHGLRVDLLLANLPYIPRPELPHLLVSKHEPTLALDGGEDGLDLIRELLGQASQLCRPGALILLEIGSGQGAAVQQLAQERLSVREVSLIHDYAGHERVVRIRLRG